MSNLVANLSTGKGTWTEIIKLINSENWENVFLITNKFGKDNFKHERAEFILIKEDSILKMSDQITKALRRKLGFNDVAVNFISGNGKEHMALLSALLKMGVGIRFVTLDNNQMIEL